MAAGTPDKWIEEQGGWANSQMLHEVYGHYVRRDMGGHARNLRQLADQEEEIADPRGPEPDLGKRQGG